MSKDEIPATTENEDDGWPIGFMVIVGLAAFYLLVRFVQMGARLVEWAF